MTPFSSLRGGLKEKFITSLMRDGSRARAARILGAALELACRRTRNKDAGEVLATAISNATPMFEVGRRRVKGALYQVPVPVPSHRKTRLAIKAIVEASRRMRGPMTQKLAAALFESYRGDLIPPDRSPRKAARLSAKEAYKGSVS